MVRRPIVSDERDRIRRLRVGETLAIRGAWNWLGRTLRDLVIALWRDRAASAIAVTTVALAPFPYGSIDAMWLSFWVLGLAGALVLADKSRLNSLHLGALAGAGALLLLTFIIAVVQTLPNPGFVSVHSAWSEASRLLGTELPGRVSVTLTPPTMLMGAPLALFLAFCCGIVLGSEPARARRIFIVLAWIGLGYGLYGILAFLQDPTMVLSRSKRHHAGNLTATFMNRNTAAAFFGAHALIWFLVLLDRIDRRLPSFVGTWRDRIALIMHRPPPEFLLPSVVFMVLLAVVFMTGSRAGVALTLAALGIAFWLRFRHLLHRSLGTLVVLGILACIALLLFQLWGESLALRFDRSGLRDPARWHAYMSALAAVADRPWLGTGLGSFADVFPAYRSPDAQIRGIFDRAHNTPLEIAVEMGIPFAMVVVGGWGLLALVVLRAALTSPSRSLVTVAGAAILFFATVHSLIDYPLQIPGYALFFYLLVGISCGTALTLRRESSAPVP